MAFFGDLASFPRSAALLAAVVKNIEAKIQQRALSRHRPTLRFNRRTMRPPRYLAMSTAGISFRLA